MTKLPKKDEIALRDWLAGQALAGRIARHGVYHRWDEVASFCYRMADAMLKARSARDNRWFPS